MIDITRKAIRDGPYIVAYTFIVVVDDKFVCRGEVTASVWYRWWHKFGGWSTA